MKQRILLLACAIALVAIPAAASPAQAVVCEGNIGGCCGEIVVPVINKPYDIGWNC